MEEPKVIVVSLPDGWPAFATYAEVAELLRVSKAALYYRVANGMCPSPVRQGASSRFSVSQVATMMQGLQPMGTFKKTFSVRSKGGRKGGKKAQKNRRVADAKLASLDTGEVT